MSRLARALALALCAALAPRAAVAQAGDETDDATIEPEDLEVYLAELREPGRLVIGFDFGIGAIDALCTGCYMIGALSLDGFAGLQVSRRVAILADVWTLAHLLAGDEERSGLVLFSVASAAARVWLVPRLWVQGGAGLGVLGSIGRGSGDAEVAPAAVLAVGGEPGHRRCSGIDLSVRLGGTIARDEASGSGGRTLVYGLAAVVGYHWN